MNTNLDRAKKLFISSKSTLIDALKLMDASATKALIILEDGRFKNVLSIGDIQRAIIKNNGLDSLISNITRKETIFSTDKETIDEIKDKLFEHKADFIPVINSKKEIVNVYFWNDFYSHIRILQPSEILNNIPVIVMAGGFGTRLKPLTNVIPKPLIPIGDSSILEKIIEKFSILGAKQYFISLNYKADLIKFYLKDKIQEGIKISYVEEDKPLGTGGALYLLKEKLTGTFIVTNCDIVIEDDYSQMYNYHIENKNDITIIGAVKHLKIPYGTLETGENGELVGMKEKPDLSFLVNTGMYILEPSVLEEVRDNHFMHITTLIENIKQKGGRVGVFPISENSWYDIGEWSEYMKILKKYM